MNLRRNLEFAGQSLLATLVPERDFLPVDGYEVAHDVGRWWDAVLRLEEAIGFAIPAELEAVALRNLKRLTNNPDCLLMNSPTFPWLTQKAVINGHNFRETFIAFEGLIRCRNSDWAREASLTLVRSLSRCFLANGRMDFPKLGSWEAAGWEQKKEDTSENIAKGYSWFDGTHKSGRCLEALVWLYESTGEREVLDLARRIAEHHLKYTLSPDGRAREEIVHPDHPGHNHSYQGTLRGLLLFGLLTHQKTYVDTVEATYRNSIRNGIVKESGFTPHDLGKVQFPNQFGDPVGDPASAGDAAQLALWLALRADCLDLLDDVERTVRARLIPQQLTAEEVRLTTTRTFAPRAVGSWGINSFSHGSKGCTPDVNSAVTHTLCDIYNNICTSNGVSHRFNLHFNYEDACVKIVSARGQRAALTVWTKQACRDILIRIPQWTPASTLQLSVDGSMLPVKRQGVFAWISGDLLHEGSEIVMAYDLPIRTTEETMHSGRTYTFKWRGDEIIGMSPQEPFLSFYPALEE